MVSSFSSFVELQNLCDTYLVDHNRHDVCEAVFSDPRFVTAPGGAKHHHNYQGGLADHTLEVAHLAMQFAEGFSGGLEQSALIAAIFHDYGKILEYKFNEDGTISTTEFKDRTGHITYSASHFMAASDFYNLGRADADEIYHAILAHHGRKEWGSPVEPRTPLAFALHSADMLSMQGWGQ